MTDKKIGRPSSYTEEVGLIICDLLSDGMSLRKVCERDDMPHKVTVLRWLRDIESFRTQYARAKDEAADSLADDIQDIGDKVLAGEYEPNAARVAIDAKKWTAAKLKPKKYSERLDLTSGGEKFDRSMTMAEIDAALAKAKTAQAEKAAAATDPAAEDTDGIAEALTHAASGFESGA